MISIAFLSRLSPSSITSHRAIEDKWKLVVSGLEKEIETLRSGYVMLIDTVGAFLERTGHVEVPHSAKVTP